MAPAFNAVHDLLDARKIDMRTAAYVRALGRMGEASLLREG